MLRALVIVGVSAALAATVPSFLSRNPDVLRTLLGDSSITGARQTPSGALPQPRTKAPATDPAYGSTVRLEPDGRGHWSAEFRMNGVRVEGLVDTGATLVALNRSTAARLGIRLTSADFVHQVTTANGRTRAAAVSIDEIEIGRIRVRDVAAMVLDDKALSGTLVGMSFLGKLRRFEASADGLLLEF